ncbi:MAG: response regulator transcription factor [Crocinitomicaceae bacterium]|nr:response regulator transcription factor [Crocinitomicaceae bacterium]
MLEVCVVEDESSLADMIRLNLELEGYAVTHFAHGKEASDAFGKGINFDLILLDVMLPGVNGVQLCRQIREISKVPILFLSAKGTTTDRIEGLKAGGNDYLPKPFDLEELLLRVAVLLGAHEKEATDSVQIGDWDVNFKTFLVKNTVNGEELSLSKKEVNLIQLFDEKEGEVIARSEILDRVWGKDQFPTTRTIDNYILNFRKIFEQDPKHPTYFHSIRGVGYKFTK